MSVLYDYEIRNFMQNEKKTKKIKEEKNNRENTEIRRNNQASGRKLQKNIEEGNPGRGRTKASGRCQEDKR